VDIISKVNLFLLLRKIDLEVRLPNQSYGTGENHADASKLCRIQVAGFQLKLFGSRMRDNEYSKVISMR
jgi:hypothetical protein